MAAPTITAVGDMTSQRTTGATSITVTTNAGVQVGDVLVAVIAGRYRTSLPSTLDAPAGWTRLTPQQRPPAPSGATTAFAMDVFMRTATVAGTASFTFTLGTGFLVSELILKEVDGRILALRGIQSATPFSAPAAGYSAVPPTNPYVPASIAVSRDDSLAIVIWGMTAFTSGPFGPNPNGWTSPAAPFMRAVDPLQDVRYAYIETDTTGALTMPELNAAGSLISWTFAVHGFPDFFAYGVQTGTPTGPSAAYGVY